ncbi:class I adenylate-forming enzyme family protein [Subtercola endophyticus]|uniref:class I adenylate-forming enzyme family protein n=1 Tax=Subtercola endophyticus TaxID=2895559 RepID=UPI001E5D052F|nr:AMP-binding protein [Subtercola endophyticus]UFS60530.1 AMP-binding protein [Subtercola endophyticus]
MSITVDSAQTLSSDEHHNGYEPNTDYDPTAFRNVFEHNFTFASAVERNIHRFANRPAISDPSTGRSWTFREFGDVTGALGEGLKQNGIGVGSVVAYQLMNRPEFAFLYVAAQGLRAVSSPMNFRLAPAETAHILNDSQPAIFVYETWATADVSAALGLADFEPPVLVAVGDGDIVPGSLRFDDLLVDGAPSFRANPEATVWDETSRLYTSGTTGMPKAVPLTSLNEVLTAHDAIIHFPLGPTDKTMNMSPWFHRGGNYCAGPNSTLYVGAEAVCLQQFTPEAVLDAVEKNKLTYVIGAPTNLERLADEQEAHPRDLSSLSGIVTMGAPLDRAAALRYQRVLTKRIANGYGTTEAFWNTYLRPEDLPDAAGAAGRACLDDDVAVVKVYADRLATPDDLADKNTHEIGEVIMRTVKSGYAYRNNPKEEAEKFHDGWIYPGDLASWDENEIVTIIGRKDDMIISGGENVHPVQVEEVLAGHPDVADSIVVGLPDEQWGEVVVAYVQPREGRMLDRAEAAKSLEDFTRESVSLAGYKRPRRYTFVTELPYTATGKKQHFVLKKQAPADNEAGKFVTP